MKINTNKILLILITAFSCVFGFSVNALEVKASTLSQGAIDNVYYTRRGGGESYLSAQYFTYDMDGKVVYCIQPGVDISTSQYNGSSGLSTSPYNDQINKKIQLIGYYGYDYTGHQTLRYRMATQALIWETVSGQIVEYWTETYGYGDYINLDAERNEIMNLVNNHIARPSFTGQTYTGVIGTELKITDNNNVLNKFSIFNANGNSVRISGNSLFITPTTVGDTSVVLYKPNYDNQTTIVYTGSDGFSQMMGYFRISDPVLTLVNIKSLGGKVIIEKNDADNNSTTPQGEATLVGAVYEIYNSEDTLIGTITIGEDNSVTSDYLPTLGTFYAKEKIPSKGYQLDPTKYYFEITADNLNPKIKVFEKVINRDFEFTKVYANDKTGIMTPEPNVKFGFYNYKGELVKEATTDNNGRLKVNLVYGTYTVKQLTSTANYEKVDDFIVEVNEMGDTVYKVLANKEVSAKLKVVKIDSDTKEVIPRAGIKFKIYNTVKKEYVCQTITYPTATKICEFETDSNGILMTPYPLSSGIYQLEEVDQVIDGYLWNKEPLKFEIGENSKLVNDNNYGIIFEVQFENKEVKGSISIVKYGEELIKENNGYYYNKVLLKNVKYGLYANDDIYSANGILVYAKGELVATLITDENGYANIKDLHLGKYYLLEMESSNGNMLDLKKHYIDLKYKDQYTEIIDIKVDLENYLPKGTLEFTKTDFSTDNALPNTLIEIYDEENNLIYSGRTDSAGKIIINNLPIGKYYILEKEAPEGYILNSERMYFEILENGEIIKVDMKNQLIIPDVPNTLKNEIPVLPIITLVLAGVGFILIHYGKKKNK